jgi:hypothetical protein
MIQEEKHSLGQFTEEICISPMRSREITPLDFEGAEQ